MNSMMSVLMKGFQEALPRCRISGSTRSGIVMGCVVFSAISLSGCAMIPDLGTPPPMKTVTQLKSDQSFPHQNGQWPKDDWWKKYGDEQLNGLIDDALKNSPTLNIADARVKQAQAMIQSASGSLFPEVTANASFMRDKMSYNYVTPESATPQNWNSYGRTTLDMSWEIDFWGKNRAALAAATSGEMAAVAEKAQTRLVLSSSVVTVYAELAHLYTVRETLNDTLTIRTSTLALFQQRHDAGLEDLSSLQQVETRQLNAKANLVAIDEAIAIKKHALAALIGDGPDRALAITAPKATLLAHEDLPPNIALDLIGRRPDIVAARLRAEAAAEKIKQKKAGFYPSVNLVAFAGFQSLGINNLTRSGSAIGSFGPAISLPIFNTQQLQGDLKYASGEYDIAVNVYNDTLTNALREVSDALTSRASLKDEMLYSQAAVASAEKAYSLTRQRYEGKVADYLDVLSSEDELVAARRKLADVNSRAFTIDVALARALGGGYTSSKQ
ncbi:efflux transporter outer membrane subunit [Enterobacter quasiroggenkampii]